VIIDPKESEPSSKAELEFLAGLEATRLRRQALYWMWRPEAIPSVTLEQAAWLLLGVDPFEIEQPAASYRVLRRRRFLELLNRLELAVSSNELQPVGRHVEGIKRRFKLVDISQLAMVKTLAMEAAEDLLTALKKNFVQRAVINRRYQAEQLRERFEAHRQFVASLGAATPAPGKTKKGSRRKYSPNPINVHVRCSSSDYNEGFRVYCEANAPHIDTLSTSNKMLDEDRRQLNIQVIHGRPRKGGASR
jgi:hypothetical protein